MQSLAVSKHLLWKDYRQLLPAIVGCWAIMAVILLLICVRDLLSKVDSVMPDGIMLVLAAPTLAAMAASGIAIGHERQTRSWNWSSSLPIPWASSLISKSIVWLLSSVAMVATLFVLFIALMQLCIAVKGFQLTEPTWLSPQIIIMTAIVVPLIVFICFSLAALIWNDTLTAFVVAAIAVAAAYVMMSDLVPRYMLGSGVRLDRTAEGIGTGLVVLFLVFFAGIVMVQLYKWRWTSGQLASIGWAGRMPTPFSSVQQRVIWQSVSWNGGASGEFRMLLVHGISTALVIRTLIFLGVVGFSLLQYRSPHGALVLCVIGAGLMGVTVFGSDHSNAAYKFLADRGVHWGKLLAGHALPPMVLALLPVIVTLFFVSQELGRNDLNSLLIVGMTLMIFAFGMFCSLCSRLAILSVCLTVGGIVIAVLAMAMFYNFWNYLLIRSTPIAYTVFIVAVEVIALLAGIVILVRRWLIYDRVSGASYYLTVLGLGIVPAHLVAAFFCFLAVPNVPWQGLEESQVLFRSQLPLVQLRRLPLEMNYQIYSTDPTRVNDAIEHGKTVLLANLGHGTAPGATMEGLGGPGKSAEEFEQELREKLKEMEADLDRIAAGPKLTAQEWELNTLIGNTAWLALYATHDLRDLEFARRAWKVNRQLMSLVDYSNGSYQVIESRLTSVLLRLHLTNDDWKFLETGGSLNELQPEGVARDVWLRHAQLNATAMRVNIHSQPWMKIALPIRWYYERLTAIQLQQQIDLINGQQVKEYPQFPWINQYQNSALAVMIRREGQLPQHNPLR